MMEVTLSTSACHIGGPNSVNPGQILLVYGTSFVQNKSRLVVLRGQGGAEDKTKNIKIISYFKEYSRATAGILAIVPAWTIESRD